VAAQTWHEGLTLDHVFVAGGSAGTAAGVVLGLWLLRAEATVHVISVSRTNAELRELLLGLINETAALLGVDVAGIEDTIRLYDEFVGAGYGALTTEGLAAIELLAREEGLVLDPVYTGKTAAGMLSILRHGDVTAEETVLFLHTGGVPGLFAKAAELQQAHRAR